MEHRKLMTTIDRKYSFPEGLAEARDGMDEDHCHEEDPGGAMSKWTDTENPQTQT